LGLNTVMAYQRAKVSAFKIVSTRTGHTSVNEMGEFSTVQDLSVDGRTQSSIFTSSRPALPTMEMWTLRNDLDSRSSSQWEKKLDWMRERESLLYVPSRCDTFGIYVTFLLSLTAFLIKSVRYPCGNDRFVLFLSLPFIQFVFGYVILYPIVLEIIFVSTVNYHILCVHMIQKCLCSERSENDIERSESSTGITNVTFKEPFFLKLMEHSHLMPVAYKLLLTTIKWEIQSVIIFVSVFKFVCIQILVLSRNILWVER